VLYDNTNYTFYYAVLIISVGYQKLKLYSYFFLLYPYILNNKLAAVISSKPKNKEIDNNLFILKLNYNILTLLYFSNILSFKTYTLSYSGIIINDNKRIFEANSKYCAGAL
jgi:hypothetical protein